MALRARPRREAGPRTYVRPLAAWPKGGRVISLRAGVRRNAHNNICVDEYQHLMRLLYLRLAMGCRVISLSADIRLVFAQQQPWSLVSLNTFSGARRLMTRLMTGLMARLMTLPPAAIAAARRQAEPESVSFLCLITPLCSYLYVGLYEGLYERAHIVGLVSARSDSSLAEGGSVIKYKSSLNILKGTYDHSYY